MYCEQCGAAHRLRARFCSACGGRLSEPAPVLPVLLVDGRARLEPVLRRSEERAPRSDPFAGFSGRLVRGYRFGALLGAGPLGAVFEAVQCGLSRAVEIRVLPPLLSRDAALMEGFRKVMEGLAAVDSPYIVPQLDIFAEQGLFCLVTAASGSSLKERLQLDGPLPEADAADLARQTALGLWHAAQRGFLHRDIKPATLVVTRDGHLRIADFGLADLAEGSAALRGTGSVFGTPGYMSQEQWEGQVDQRSDLYSLGCTLYELVTGEERFNAPLGMSLVAGLIARPGPRVPGCSPALARIIGRLLEEDPAARFPDGASLAQALEPLARPGRALEITPMSFLEASPPTPSPDAPPRPRAWTPPPEDKREAFRSWTPPLEDAPAPVRKKVTQEDSSRTKSQRDAEEDPLRTQAKLPAFREDPLRTQAKLPAFREDPLRTRSRLDAVDATPWEMLSGSGSSSSVAVALQMVHVPAGNFVMGSDVFEGGRDPDENAHKVVLPRAFYMKATPVTQGEYAAVMGSNPSSFKGVGTRAPVEGVSWYDAVRYCNRLSEKEGLRPAYSIDGEEVGFLGGERTGYRLPTEAEWEYACRAGTLTPYSTGTALTARQANYNLVETTEVRLYPPNPWGLYDMHGNVWEWCWDWYGAYPRGSVKNPRGPRSGLTRVLRGGGWDSQARVCRSAARSRFSPSMRTNVIGFRTVISVPG